MSVCGQTGTAPRHLAPPPPLRAVTITRFRSMAYVAEPRRRPSCDAAGFPSPRLAEHMRLFLASAGEPKLFNDDSQSKVRGRCDRLPRCAAVKGLQRLGGRTEIADSAGALRMAASASFASKSRTSILVLAETVRTLPWVTLSLRARMRGTRGPQLALIWRWSRLAPMSQTLGQNLPGAAASRSVSCSGEEGGMSARAGAVRYT